MGVSDRIADRLIEAGVPLDRQTLGRAARRLLADEAPLAGPDTVTEVVDGLIGLGPIEELLRDPAVSDVLVNRFDDIWVERAGRLEPTSVRFPDPEAVTAAVERVIAPLGLRLDRASPAVDARLPDGSRLHAIVPPISIDGPAMAVRRFTEAVPTLDALVELRCDPGRGSRTAPGGSGRPQQPGGGRRNRSRQDHPAQHPLQGDSPRPAGRHGGGCRRADHRGPLCAARSQAAQQRWGRPGVARGAAPPRPPAPTGSDHRWRGAGARGHRPDRGHDHRPRRFDGHDSRLLRGRGPVAARDPGPLRGAAGAGGHHPAPDPARGSICSC